MATKVRVQITITEAEAVKLRIAAARQHMPVSRLASLYVQSRLRNMHVVEPPIIHADPLPGYNDLDSVPF